ncbi:HAD-IA family hydrolase [Antrihabitans stalactiti]|uniref:HAD family hydrolase n=1 Tax=Antrihabitans stalactiti TaxID=2584121 RepID=A0A848K8J3_9NOCA|nr:HAD-IA family hydrolase [Antrihabitans stalactiti]NMN94771.1 HAD family hydrolase [Antrihabitans stalactiti]
MLFDLDGTLTDSASGIIAGFRHALAAVGAPEPPPEVVADVVGPPMLETFRRLGLDEDRAQAAWRAYFDLYDDGGGWAQNAVYEGIEPVLLDLFERGIRLGVATSKAQRLAVRILDHFELSKYFEFIGGASDDGKRRAKVDVVAHTLGSMDVAPVVDATPDVVMVGDRSHDVRGAAHWGIPTIFAGWGYGLAGESDGAVWIAESVARLAELVSER